MLTALAMFSALTTAAQTGQAHTPAFEPPYWSSPPSPDAASEYSPRFAIAIGQDGYVTLTCVTRDVSGPPRNCEIVEESPTGLGFGQAALKIAQLCVIEPRRVDGRPSAGRITFSIPFMADSLTLARPRPYKGPPPSDLALVLGREAALGALGEFRQAFDDDFYDGLASERIAVVRPWVEELLPIDEIRFLDDLGLMFARVYTMMGLEDRLAKGAGPPAPDPEAMQALVDTASSDLASPKDGAGILELRRRYCQAFDCEVRRQADD